MKLRNHEKNTHENMLVTELKMLDTFYWNIYVGELILFLLSVPILLRIS